MSTFQPTPEELAGADLPSRRVPPGSPAWERRRRRELEAETRAIETARKASRRNGRPEEPEPDTDDQEAAEEQPPTPDEREESHAED